MYIRITDIVGEKRIDLSYLSKTFDSSEEVAIVSLFSDNIQYMFIKNWKVEVESRNNEIMAEAIYTRRELINSLKGKIELPNLKKILE